jgi:hypothetical protein
VETLGSLQRRYEGTAHRNRATVLVIGSEDRIPDNPVNQFYFPSGPPAELRCLLDGVDPEPSRGTSPRRDDQNSNILVSAEATPRRG